MSVPAIDPADTAPLERRHRDAMLDLVLAWGTLDGALGMLLSTVLGLPLPEGAEQIGRMTSSGKLASVIKRLRAVEGGESAARILRGYKKTYERHSMVRNRIAHSRCIGFSVPNSEYVVFMVFERVGADNLVVEAIPISEMRRATCWGEQMTALALKLANGASD